MGRCAAGDRPTWSTVTMSREDRTRYLDEIKTWLTANGIDPSRTVAAVVVSRADGGRELHIREFLPCECECGSHDSAVWRNPDWTIADGVATRRRAVPMTTDPPSIPSARCA